LLTWQTLDVSSWQPGLDENRGLRSKRWVLAPDGSSWLRKEPRGQRPYEPPVEMLMLQLARESGVPAAEGVACQWSEGGGFKRGLVVRSFVDRTREQLVSGTQLLRRHDPTYEPEAKWQHTLDRVREVLAQQEREGGRNLLEDFARMLAFDAWIGNGDRHQDNWSVIIPEQGSGSRLSPMYDPAACLGTELQDNHLQLDTRRRTDAALQTYILRCPSGFGDGTGALQLTEVVDNIGNWPEWTGNMGSWLAAFRSALNTLKGFLPSVDPSWLPEHRKTFMLSVLEHRLTWLEQRE
jgi:hypothetical protein